MKITVEASRKFEILTAIDEANKREKQDFFKENELFQVVYNEILTQVYPDSQNSPRTMRANVKEPYKIKIIHENERFKNHLIDILNEHEIKILED